jgi:hypothetical protein
MKHLIQLGLLCVTINFSAHAQLPNGSTAPNFTLTDIDMDPVTKQTETTLQKFALNKTLIDPITGKKHKKYVSILDVNQKKGETVFAASDIETLEEYLISSK